MRSHNYFMKAVASLLTVTMSALPIHSYANGSQDQDITAVGKEAQAFGQNLSNSFKSSSGTVQDGTISMPTLKDGQFQMNGGSQIDVNDLFPERAGPTINLIVITSLMPINLMWAVCKAFTTLAMTWTAWGIMQKGRCGVMPIVLIHQSLVRHTRFFSMPLIDHALISVMTRY